MVITNNRNNNNNNSYYCEDKWFVAGKTTFICFEVYTSLTQARVNVVEMLFVWRNHNAGSKKPQHPFKCYVYRNQCLYLRLYVNITNHNNIVLSTKETSLFLANDKRICLYQLFEINWKIVILLVKNYDSHVEWRINKYVWETNLSASINRIKIQN